MGFRDNYSLTVDIPIGQKVSFPVDAAFLESLFTTPFADSKSDLNDTIRIAREFTDLTGREVAFDYYQSFRLSDTQQLRVSPLNLVVPSLGDQKSVFAPQMTGHELGINGDVNFFYAPLFHLHTHPPFSYAAPSNQDLFVANLRQYQDYVIGKHSFKRHTHPIEVILGHRNSLLMYRLTDDEDAFTSFYKSYCTDHGSLYEDHIAKKMNESGAFTAYGRISSNDKLLPIDAIKEIAKSFAHTMHVTRNS